MPDWLEYKGIEVPDATPTGAAGLRLKEDLQALADWRPKSKWDGTANPTVDDDITADFYPGSLWLNVTNSALFLCLDNTEEEAVWIGMPLGGNVLSIISVDDNYTAAAGDLIMADLSTDSITIGFPASPAVNDRIGVKLAVASGSRTVTLDPPSSVEIDGEATVVLYVQNDYLEVVWDGTMWRVVVDGIQPHNASLVRATTQSITDNSATKVDLDTELFDVGGIADPTTNHRFEIRRSGKYLVSVSGIGPAATDAGEVWNNLIFLNGSDRRTTNVSSGGADLGIGAPASVMLDLSAGDYLEFYILQTEGSNQNTPTTSQARPEMSVTEIRA